jgi:diguanylate cyclase (GGDEF)-like protein
MGAATTATFDDDDRLGGDGRLVTVRKVRGNPLWVSVSTNKAQIYGNSWGTLKLNAIAAGLLTLLILAAMERVLRTEAAARHKAAQLQLTLENMSQGIMLVTKDLEIPIINSRCGELLGLPPAFIEKPPRFDQLIEFQTSSRESREPDGGTASAPVQTKKAQAQFTISEQVMPNGTVIEVRSGHLPDGSFVQTFTDITKRREAEAHVARLASEDPLTGLPNRRVFRTTLDQMSGQMGDAGAESDLEYAVLFLDLDRFKVVNDTLGHRLGDLLLQEVAKRLQALLQPNDLLARLGGDEFAIVLNSLASRAYLEDVATRLIEAVSQPYEIDGHRLPNFH